MKHDWRNGYTHIGSPAEYVKEVSRPSGLGDPHTLNTTLVEEKWDLVINVGHVVPHEVLGFANHNKTTSSG